MHLRTSSDGQAGSYPKWRRWDSLSRLRGRVGRGKPKSRPCTTLAIASPSRPPPRPSPASGRGSRVLRRVCRLRRCAASRNDGEWFGGARAGARVNILSIQSHVAYGHVGNSAAVFALQRLGCEVWPVHTVQFSNHTGYGGWKGEVFSADMIDAVVEGIAERGVLASCDGVLSGYVGSVEIGAAVLRAVGRVKAANPGAVYCCDPVIGNRRRGVFVQRGVPEFFRERAIPLAEIVTPNHFELDRLIGDDSVDMGQVVSAIGLLHARGPARDPRHLGRGERDAARPHRRRRVRRCRAISRAHAEARRARETAPATSSPRCSSTIICAAATWPRRWHGRPRACSAC